MPIKRYLAATIYQMQPLDYRTSCIRVQAGRAEIWW